MKYLHPALLPTLLAALALIACGDDSGSNSSSTITVDNATLDSVQTEDDLSACLSKNEGDSVWVKDESAIFVCIDRRWEKLEEETETDIKPEVKSSSSGKSDGKSSSSDKDEAGSSSSDKEDYPEDDDELPKVIAGSFTDDRDGKTYKTVQIGGQVWFAENLNYDDGHGLCPLKNAENCEKYGRLYNFYEKDESNLYSVCPDGWHIPDSLDWAELVSYVSANNDDEPVGVSLKASTGWYSEGDTVLIEGNLNGLVPTSDSARVGATRGTDRFGFGALPAGSCWKDGACYANDDTRFYFTGAPGGSFKLAFDKDDFMYSEDGVYGWVSARCLQNSVIKIDPIPPVDVVDTLVWMVEDLTHDGSAEFASRYASYACPAGWRLPTSSELETAVESGKFTVPTTTRNVEYFIFDNYNYSNGVTVNCYNYGCFVTSPGSKSERHIRCVSKGEFTTVSDCACTASELDSATNSVTWSFSGCKESNDQISDYTWDFGSNSANVTVSGTEATKMFDSLETVAPIVKINGQMKVGDEYVKISQRVLCPTVKAGHTEFKATFKNRENEQLEEGKTYTATLDGDCMEYTTPFLECKPTNEQSHSAIIPLSATVSGETYSGTAYSLSTNLDKSICNGEFSISVSEDMECNIRF